MDPILEIEALKTEFLKMFLSIFAKRFLNNLKDIK